MIAPTQSPTMKAQPLAQAPTPQIDTERKHLMREAWKAYRGEFQRPLKVAEGQPDDNVISNRCAPIVDKGVSFLFGQILKMEATDKAKKKARSLLPPTSLVDRDPLGIQDFLEGIWGDPDDRMTLLSQLAINGGVCGQSFFKLLPAQGFMKYPRIVVMNPLLIRMVTSPDDCSVVLAYLIEYAGTDDWQKRQVIARVDPDALAGVAGEYDLDDTWEISNYARRGAQGSWEQVSESTTWDYPFAPIFSCQNLPNPNEPWGNPDLTPDLINQNKVLNFIQSNTSRILKFHGHPKTYASGVSATQINIGVDDLICLPSPDAKLANLEMHSDLRSSLEFAAIIRADMDEQSRVPAVALGRLESLPRGSISGVALQLLFQPLIEKTVQKQRLYGRLIRDISRAALVIGGMIPIEQYEDYDIELHWQPLLPADDLVAAQTSVILQTLGISNNTLQQQLGYDPDTEADKSARETSQQTTNYAHGVGVPPPVPPESPFIGGGGKPA